MDFASLSNAALKGTSGEAADPDLGIEGRTCSPVIALTCGTPVEGARVRGLDIQIYDDVPCWTAVR